MADEDILAFLERRRLARAKKPLISPTPIGLTEYPAVSRVSPKIMASKEAEGEVSEHLAKFREANEQLSAEAIPPTRGFGRVGLMEALSIPPTAAASAVKGAQVGLLGGPGLEAMRQQFESREDLGSLLARQLTQGVAQTPQQLASEQAAREEFQRLEQERLGTTGAGILSGLRSFVDPSSLVGAGGIRSLAGRFAAERASALAQKTAARAAAIGEIPKTISADLAAQSGSREAGNVLYNEMVEQLTKGDRPQTVPAQLAKGDRPELAVVLAKTRADEIRKMTSEGKSLEEAMAEVVEGRSLEESRAIKEHYQRGLEVTAKRRRAAEIAAEEAARPVARAPQAAPAGPLAPTKLAAPPSPIPPTRPIAPRAESLRAKQLAPTLQAGEVRSGPLTNALESARAKIQEKVAPAVPVLKNAQAKLAYLADDYGGLPMEYYEVKQRAFNRINSADQEIAKIARGVVKGAKSDLKDWNYGLGMTARQKQRLGMLRMGDATTPYQEREWGKLMDRHLEGGRPGAIQRMQAIRGNLQEALKLETGREAKKLSDRISDIDSKIERLETRDKDMPIWTDKEAEKLSRLALPTIEHDMKAAATLIKIAPWMEEGMLNFMGRYAARLPTPEEAVALKGLPVELRMKALSAKTGRFQERAREVTPAIQARIELQRKDPIGNFVKAAHQENRAIQSRYAFEEIAQEPKLSSVKARLGWERVSEKEFGSLRGKYLRKDVYEDLKQSFREGPSVIEKVLNETIAPLNRLWALGNTVLSLSTHARNVSSNIGINYANFRIDPARHWQDYRAGILSVWKKDELFQRWIKSGGQVETAGGGELQDFFAGAYQATDYSGFISNLVEKIQNLPLNKQAAWLYHAEDGMMRIAAFKHITDDLARHGMRGTKADQLAARMVMDAHPDYRAISRVWRSVRLLFPLATFSYKMMMKSPRLLTGGLIGGRKYLNELPPPLRRKYGDPAVTLRLGGIAGGLWAINEATERFGDLDKKTWDELQANVPRYQREGLYAKNISRVIQRLPLRLPNGDVQFLDLTYNNPWPSLNWTAQRTKEVFGKRPLDPVRLLEWLEPTHPGYQAAKARFTGKDPFTGRRLWSEEIQKLADQGDKAAIDERKDKLWTYIREQIIPPYTPVYGRAVKQVAAAARGEEFRGKTQPLSEALLHRVAGLRVARVNLEKERRKRKKEEIRGRRELIKSIPFVRKEGSKEELRKLRERIGQIGETRREAVGE